MIPPHASLPVEALTRALEKTKEPHCAACDVGLPNGAPVCVDRKKRYCLQCYRIRTGKGRR